MHVSNQSSQTPSVQRNARMRLSRGVEKAMGRGKMGVTVTVGRCEKDECMGTCLLLTWITNSFITLKWIVYLKQNITLWGVWQKLIMASSDAFKYLLGIQKSSYAFSLINGFIWNGDWCGLCFRILCDRYNAPCKS